MQVGLYGGTFDPVHYGHLAVASEVQQVCELGLVLFVPAAQSPLRERPYAASAERLRMCEIALAGRHEFAVSDVEIRRAAPSYTVDTLRAVHAERPEHELLLIVGTDALADLPAWRDLDCILRLARVIAVARPGYAAAPPPELLAAVPAVRRRLRIHHMPPVDISSSGVRRLVAQGRPIDAYVPPGVRDHIARRRLYQTPAGNRGTPI